MEYLPNVRQSCSAGRCNSGRVAILIEIMNLMMSDAEMHGTAAHSFHDRWFRFPDTAEKIVRFCSRCSSKGRGPYCPDGPKAQWAEECQRRPGGYSCGPTVACMPARRLCLAIRLATTKATGADAMHGAEKGSRGLCKSTASFRLQKLHASKYVEMDAFIVHVNHGLTLFFAAQVAEVMAAQRPKRQAVQRNFGASHSPARDGGRSPVRWMRVLYL